MTTETLILAAGTAAGNSSDVTLEAGFTATICAFATADFTADFSAVIKYKIGSVYFTASGSAIGSDSGGAGETGLNRHRFSRHQSIIAISGPIKFRVERSAGAGSVGFYAVT